MKKRYIIAALASSLSLTLAPAFGCSGPEDPTDDGNGTTATGGTSSGSGTGSGTTGSTAGSGSGSGSGSTSGSGSGGTGDAGMFDDSGGSGGGSGTSGSGSGGTGDTGTEECMLNMSYYGQVGREADTKKPHRGGTPSTDVTLESAGLQNVIDSIKSIRSDNSGEWPTETVETMEGKMIEVDKTVALEGEDTITVDGAVVTATSYNGKNFDAGQSQFWLQDGDATMLVYLDKGEEIKMPKIQAGQRLKFDVTGVKLYNNAKPEITVVENFTVKEGDNDKVPYREMTGKELTAEDWGKLIRIGGTLTEEKPECPGSEHCYVLKHGDKTIEYRTDLKSAHSAGTCITWMGPVSVYKGPLSQDTKNVQLEAINFDWRYIPRD